MPKISLKEEADFGHNCREIKECSILKQTVTKPQISFFVMLQIQ